MRTTARIATAALLTAPLLTSSVTAANAAPSQTERYSTSGTIVDAQAVVLGPVDGLEGNVHQVWITGEESKEGDYAYGFIESYTCPDGVTDPGMDATSCAFEGSADIAGPATVTTDRKLTTGSVNGTFNLSTWECDDATQECWETVLGTIDIDATVSATSGLQRSRSTESYTDQDTGYRYRGTMSQTYRSGEATVTVNGTEGTGQGRVGTFSFSSTERLPA